MSRLAEAGGDPIRVHSMMICPFAQRTRLHLELLGLPYELDNLDICRPRPDWFLELNPAGQVPVLVRGEDVICDSSIISEYLQEVASEPLPFGATPAERAWLRGCRIPVHLVAPQARRVGGTARRTCVGSLCSSAQPTVRGRMSSN